ncbi:host-nuclease inhibitor Gam family protein [Escherichia coli]|uniref:host-nuclease inhibitor Gam family protein n=1 Tax=Escherichia coli TaxID=562 RepID=UPI00211F1A56|nr:host-nuclease inhibitor Gam family protein [Escherichia coli]
MNAYYIQDRLEAQSWARHYQQLAREEKEAELADDMEKSLPQPERDITPVNDETMQEINTLLIALDKTWDDDLLPLCSQIFRRDIRASSELTQAEAVKALGFLKQKATEQKVAA